MDYERTIDRQIYDQNYQIVLRMMREKIKEQDTKIEELKTIIEQMKKEVY